MTNPDTPAITAWTQHADFEHISHDEVELEQALALVRDHDWDAAADLFNARLEDDGEGDACPPGIGFNKPSGDLLHIYLSGEGTFTILVSLVRKTRLLWLIPFRYTKNFETSGHPLDETLMAIEDYFDEANNQ